MQENCSALLKMLPHKWNPLGRSMAAVSRADFSSLPCPSSTQDAIDPITAEYHIVLPFLLLLSLSFAFFPAWLFSPIQSFVWFLTFTCLWWLCLLPFVCMFLFIAGFPQAHSPGLPCPFMFTPLNLSHPVCLTSSSMLSLSSKLCSASVIRISPDPMQTALWSQPLKYHIKSVWAEPWMQRQKP